MPAFRRKFILCLGVEEQTWHAHVSSSENAHAMLTPLAVVAGSPILPLYPEEIQAPALGMAVDILDSSKEHPVSIANTGEPGELVCRQPFPSQPVFFWGEKGTDKYRSTYFGRFGDKIWTQGDFVSSSPVTGGFLMFGRS